MQAVKSKLSTVPDVQMRVFQSREEWLLHRTGIGGSDAAAIMGMNPYMSNQDLWEIKTGRRRQEDISDKPYVVYGIKAEDHLRELFKLDFPELTVDYAENNMFFNLRYPWAHASLDGWLTDPNGRRGILEIKTSEILKSMQKEKWYDQIPDNYYIQLLHYLLITDADFAVLKAQLKYDYNGVYLQTRHYHIERTEVTEDIEILKNAEAKFWEQVQNETRPDLLLPGI